jgi:hypothetical protein
VLCINTTIDVPCAVLSKFQIVDKGADPTQIPSILPGMARESINGALGLYIHPLHWASARLIVPSVLSQMSTGSPLAYASEMIKTVPFTSLMRYIMDFAATLQVGGGEDNKDAAAKDGNALSDAAVVLFWQVLRTCQHIAESYKLHDPKSNPFVGLLATQPDTKHIAAWVSAASLPLPPPPFYPPSPSLTILCCVLCCACACAVLFCSVGCRVLSRCRPLPFCTACVCATKALTSFPTTTPPLRPPLPLPLPLPLPPLQPPTPKRR